MKKILFLEDSISMGKIYEMCLKKSGYTVFLAKDTNEVESILEKESIDFAILDYSIDGDERTGVDMISVVKEKNPRSKVFIFSNYSDRKKEIEASLLGADQWLLKIQLPPQTLAKFLEKYATFLATRS